MNRAESLTRCMKKFFFVYTFMDTILHIADHLLFDSMYHALPASIYLDASHPARQSLSLFLLILTFGVVIYFGLATFSFRILYDHKLMQHPRFLPNQVQQEIRVAVGNFVPMAVLTVPWMLGQVNGKSKLYDNVADYGMGYLVWSVVWFILFTDALVYWIHRGLHHRAIYPHLHKLHHRWVVPTPYASHAFHYMDGYLQSVPYHLFVYLFPMHKHLYLVLFGFVNVWTVLIHDGEYWTHSAVLNDASHHMVHHLMFNYNFGQYLTVWDRVGGTHKDIPAEWRDKKRRHKEL
jgi:lathosterol oxidase